jgi:hypothetical protein
MALEDKMSLSGDAKSGDTTIVKLTWSEFNFVMCCCMANLATSYSVAAAFPIVPLWAAEKGISDVTAVRFRSL